MTTCSLARSFRFSDNIDASRVRPESRNNSLIQARLWIDSVCFFFRIVLKMRGISETNAHSVVWDVHFFLGETVSLNITFYFVWWSRMGLSWIVIRQNGAKWVLAWAKSLVAISHFPIQDDPRWLFWRLPSGQLVEFVDWKITVL